MNLTEYLNNENKKRANSSANVSALIFDLLLVISIIIMIYKLQLYNFKHKNSLFYLMSLSAILFMLLSITAFALGIVYLSNDNELIEGISNIMNFILITALYVCAIYLLFFTRIIHYCFNGKNPNATLSMSLLTFLGILSVIFIVSKSVAVSDNSQNQRNSMNYPFYSDS